MDNYLQSVKNIINMSQKKTTSCHIILTPSIFRVNESTLLFFYTYEKFFYFRWIFILSEHIAKEYNSFQLTVVCKT